MKHVAEMMSAYSDCNEYSGERDLDYRCEVAMTHAELLIAFEALTPDGYNNFDPKVSIPKVIQVFGEDAEYFVAREGSVCVYVKPKRPCVWLNRWEIGADELSYSPITHEFRLWWD